MLPTLTGVSWDFVSVYAYFTKGRFLQHLALLKTDRNPCQSLELIVSSNNGLHE